VRAVLRWAVAVTALAALVYLPGAGAEFSNTAECQEALVVWEMVHTGDWVLPRVNGEQIPSKPPLYHWIAIGVSELAGGVSEFSVRLPSILAAALAVGLVFAAGSYEWGAAAGLSAALVLATSPEWAKWATTARTDATFALFLTAAFLLGERWLRTGSRSTLVALAAATGMATLAKGFSGAGLVAIVFVIEMWRLGGWRRLRLMDVTLAAVIFGALALSWYGAAMTRAGSAFVHKQIVLENVLRFFPYEEGGPSRQHSVFFYVPMLFTGMFPWSIALPTAVWHALRERPNAGEGAAFSRYLISWAAVVFVICTAASGKRTNYLLPLYPAAALLVGRELSTVLRQAQTRGRARGLVIAGSATAAVIGAVAVVLVAWHGGVELWRPVVPWLHPQDRVLVPEIAARIGPPRIAAILVAFALAAVTAAATARRAWRVLYAAVAATTVIATTAACAYLPPLEADLKSFAPFTRRVAERVGEEPIAFYRAPDLSVLFYLRRHVPVERQSWASLPRPGWALVWQKDWETASPELRSAAEVADESPPASVGRPETRLLLVRLSVANAS
jgi:4-amino-4-deoxy-L-arabinose transferase-like glycosyltransferase